MRAVTAALILSVLAIAVSLSPAAAQDSDSLGDESVLETCSLYALVLRAPGHETDIINVCFSRWGILCCCIYIYGRLWLLCG